MENAAFWQVGPRSQAKGASQEGGTGKRIVPERKRGREARIGESRESDEVEA